MKKWSTAVICSCLGVFLLLGCFTALIDPFFLYHAPILDRGYLMGRYEEIYYSPGILRSFPYEAAIIGTSMAENSDPGDVERLFGLKTVKATMSAGQPADFRELMSLLHRGTKLVIRAVDMLSNVTAAPEVYRDEPRPGYLYNNNPFDDIEYLLGTDVLERSYETVKRARAGEYSTSLAAYARWSDIYPISKEEALKNYERPELADSTEPADAYLANVREQFERNIKPSLEGYPGTEFYMFNPPVSMLYWDRFTREGKADALLDGYFELMRLCLEYDNVRFFWFDNRELTTDLENYRDQSHYGPEWNTWMFEQMRSGGYELTSGGLEAVKAEFAAFVHGYDYESLFD